MKERANITIDEDIMSYIRTHKEGKLSEYFNSLARDDIEKNSDPNQIINSFNREIKRIEEKRNKFLEGMENIIIEGTLKEREEAKKVIKEEKKRQKEKIKKLKEKYILIKNKKLWTDFFTEFNGEIDMKKLLDMAGEFQLKGIKIGAVDLRGILDNIKIMKKDGN